MDLEQDDWTDNQQDSNSLKFEGNKLTHSMSVHLHTYTNTIFWIPFIASVSSVTEPEDEPGLCKKAVMCFCGLEQKKNVQKLTPEEEEELQKSLTDTSEVPLWRNVCNANAIILLCVAVFCHGYFA